MIHWREAGDGIGVITLDRPPVNAFDWAAKHELMALLEDLAGRPEVRSVVFCSGLPRTFCAGSDLHELAADHHRSGSATERTRFELAMWERLSSLPLVTIAAIEGHALGSGLELAIACDLRIAGSEATLGLPEVRIGGAPGVQTLARLPLMVGLGVARRMLLSGESVSAEEAASVGLVDTVTGAGEALPAALRLAARMADSPTSSVRFLKAALAAGEDAAQASVAARVFGEVEALFTAPEMREGISAFREKRVPDFRQAVGTGDPSTPR